MHRSPRMFTVLQKVSRALSRLRASGRAALEVDTCHSRLGGLWTDRRNAAAELACRMRAGAVRTEDAPLLRHWIRAYDGGRYSSAYYVI